MNPDSDRQKREVRLTLDDPMAVCESLGLIGGRRSFVRQSGRGVSILCPIHGEKNTPSCSVIRRDGGVFFKCHACQESGDVFDLIAAARGWSTRSDFREILLEGARIGGLHSLAYEIQTGRRSDTTESEPKIRAVPEPEPDRRFPPSEMLAEFLSACIPVTDDGEVSGCLQRRGIDPEVVAESRLGYALPLNATLLPRNWAYKGRPWVETGHRLILPVRDASGSLVSVRAWRVIDGDSPKRLPPGGFKASGVVLACPLATSMLSGLLSPKRVWVTEGESDWLTAATHPLKDPTAVLGVFSGAWSPEIASRIRPGTKVYVWTDLDAAGDRYAKDIERSLLPRGVFVERWKGQSVGT